MSLTRRTLPKYRQLIVPVFMLMAFAGMLSAALSGLKLDEQAVYEEARYFLELGNYQQAADIWEGLLEQQPDNAMAAFHIGKLSLLLDPDSATAYFNRAVRSTTYAEPAQRFLNTLRLAEFNEDWAYRYTLYGQALAAEGDWQMAKEVLLKAVEANPEYSEAWAYLGQSQMQLNEDGYPALEKALQLNPDSLAANVFMAAYWRSQGYPQTALPFLQTAESLEPDNTSLMTDLGFTLAAAGDIASAIEKFQHIIEIAPDDLDTWATIAEFSLDNDLQIKEIGLPAARQALLLAPENASTLVLMARAYSQQGDNLIALRFFKRALDANPADPAVHYYLGLHYLAHDDTDLARNELERTIELGTDGDLSHRAETILRDYFE